MEKKRNQLIREALQEDRKPMLPFELESAHNALRGHVERQKHLGSAMAGAMSESSETFHDNAPAEAITHDTHINTIQAKRVKDAINNVAEFDMPTNEPDEITLGTIFELSYDGGKTSEPFMLTGNTTKIDDDTREQLGIDSEVQFVTIGSPLGQAVFDKRAEDTVKYNAGVRELSVIVTAVRPTIF